jgi:hypothetical protein
MAKRREVKLSTGSAPQGVGVADYVPDPTFLCVNMDGDGAGMYCHAPKKKVLAFARRIIELWGGDE